LHELKEFLIPGCFCPDLSDDVYIQAFTDNPPKNLLGSIPVQSKIIIHEKDASRLHDVHLMLDLLYDSIGVLCPPLPPEGFDHGAECAFIGTAPGSRDGNGSSVEKFYKETVTGLLESGNQGKIRPGKRGSYKLPVRVVYLPAVLNPTSATRS